MDLKQKRIERRVNKHISHIESDVKAMKKNKRFNKSSAKRAEAILKLIRTRNTENILEETAVIDQDKFLNNDEYRFDAWNDHPDYNGIFSRDTRKGPNPRPMDADQWQIWKRDHIEEYGGEKVKETGFTDSEFLDYFKNNKRECQEPHSKLRALIAKLHAHDDATKDDK